MNKQVVPDWAQVNIGARYTYERTNGKPIVIRANIDNLFNANYWNATSFGQLSASNPRSFMLAATFEFLLAHACESMTSASVMLSDFAALLDPPYRSTVLGIAQVVMCGELAVNRALDTLDATT